MNWQEGDHIRLIFHAFKPLKDTEAQSLAEMMNSLGNYQADYAFLHLVDKHPYQLFDEAQQGVWCGSGKPMKGVDAPERGRFIQLTLSGITTTTKALLAQTKSHPYFPATTPKDFVAFGTI